MLQEIPLSGRVAALVLLVSGLLLGTARAQTETVLFTFCEQEGICAEGAGPFAGVVLDQKGNLYGTTFHGGTGCNGSGCGVVFKLTPKGKETVLHTFCTQDNCADGEYPSAGPTLDQKGNLYGTTDQGGATSCNYGSGCGVVFKITPEGKETVLYSFCAQTNCPDGATPIAGLIFDQKGNLYGTTESGGSYGGGVVFKLTPRGKETVLYSFCAQANCTDGAGSVAGLIFDQKRNLYGTTEAGGARGAGVVFKLTPKGKETVLYSFCAQVNCTDGAQPAAGLVFDKNGNLYGTTVRGGPSNYGNCYPGGEDNCGVVFRLTRNGKETVLYSFCAQNNCTDGASPYAGVVFDQEGNLYGTTYNGGTSSGCESYGPYGCGVVFKLTPKGKETVLHTFCAQSNCTDGANPYAGLVFDQKGNLYGTTELGGSSSCDSPFGCGVVFKLTP